MIRVFITSALLFLLPFILFAIYATVSDFLRPPAPATSQPDTTSAWTNPPIGWMAGIGAALVVGAFIYLTVTSGPTGGPGGTYHPPVMKDGKLQPGYID